MKVIRLEAENFKRLKAIDITPKENTVVISGANTEGKTSILDSLWVALGGKAASKGLKKPIRDGEESAHVTVDLGDIVVKRTWTGNDKTYLTIENRDGYTIKSPQAILDELIGNLSFDPLAFSNMKDGDQRETLLDLVDIDLDLNKWEEERQGKYDERTLVNRNVKELQGQLAGILVPEDTPDEETSASTILSEIEKAQSVQSSNDEKRRGSNELRKELETLDKDMEETKRFIKEHEEDLAVMVERTKEVRSELQEKNSEITALVDPDMSVFQQRLESVEDTNRAVREKQKRVEIEVKLEDAKKDSDRLTELIGGMDTKKSDAIEAAKFPIEHLGFDETGVTYKGIPFGQCSAAERLRVSVSMALAINPKLKIIRITDGSLLDSKNMKIIKEMVDENDFQCWIERVQDSPDGASIYIEDGSIINEEG
jgi:DNA repair exonuclease SbcCD ATPase subunit